MERRIIVKPAFEKYVLSIHQYLIREFSAKTAVQFLDRLESGLTSSKNIPLLANLPSNAKA